MKFIHISDPHLVEPGKTLWGGDGQDRFDRCLDDVANLHEDAAFAVISGDLCDKGEPEAYAWLAARLKQFPIETILMLGNHDDRAAFCSVFADAPTDPAGYVQQSLATDQAAFIFLDTLKDGDGEDGLLCEARLSWFRDELRRAGATPTFIFMHHPPLDVGMPYMDRIKLSNADAFAETIEAAQNICHIFFGHIHRAAYFNWKGVPCTSLPGVNHQVPLSARSVGTNYSGRGLPD